jgi:hypothetical protein
MITFSSTSEQSGKRSSLGAQASRLHAVRNEYLSWQQAGETPALPVKGVPLWLRRATEGHHSEVSFGEDI